MVFARFAHAACPAACLAIVATSLCLATPVLAEEPYEHPYYISGRLGALTFEGDEEVENGFNALVSLGYDYSERWSFEAFLGLAPSLDGNTRNSFGTVINRLEEKTGEDSTWAATLGVDALLHVTRWERVDPYLSLGAALTYYGEDFGNQIDPAIRAGGGVMYHFNDVWALRADGRFYFAGADTEANSSFSAGFVYTIGAATPPDLQVVGAGKDSDADGLSDADEATYGTDMYDPDTDKDDLSDGDEVLKYGTDPLNPDTDWDQLKDGEEVYRYRTDPTLRDTDGGGVSDGHEVLDDNTNPLDGVDDLLLYELNVQFDTDKAVIKDEYRDDLDVVGKVLERDPGATAVIEGHADQRKTSNPKYNRDLSARRAQAILQYLVDHWDIEADRLKAVGHGFDRPKAPNDPIHGNPVNRRSEIYIRLSDEGLQKVTR